MSNNITTLFILIALFVVSGCNAQSSKKEKEVKIEKPTDKSVAYFASGCFWCVEAIFESVEGVAEVVSGYAGGKAATANYSLVSSGQTNHAEAVEVFYDAEVVSYETLLKVFFGSHDPTTLNQQGPDKGPQYRSSIFYTSEIEKQAAQNYITLLTNEGQFPKPIVTEVVPFEAFYDAEGYHQDYERKNPNQPYVKAVSVPRLKKFQAKFPELLKENHK